VGRGGKAAERQAAYKTVLLLLFIIKTAALHSQLLSGVGKSAAPRFLKSGIAYYKFKPANV
jgi:hypothetical protein